jgi:diaminopimelate decarboxylase
MIRAPHIYFENENLMVEGIMVEEIIDEVGTPSYIYSKSSFIEKLNILKEAFINFSTIICYSIKVCHNTNIIRTFAKEGCGADIVSGGELYRALKAGVNPRMIVYSGVGKTTREITEAINADILMLNVESEQELERINLIGNSLNRKVPVSIRVNPDVDAKTHPYITTGMKTNKFGIDSKKVIEIFRRAYGMGNIEVCGIDLHIGSQLLDPKPYGDAMKITAEYVKQLKAENIDIKYVDVGGGLGIAYKEGHNAISVRKYASMITEPFKDIDGITFILEPGRFLMAEAGILVNKVQYVKENLYGKRFLIVDTGMHHLIRPPLYGGYHGIIPVKKNTDVMIEADIVGPICESTDFLGKERLIENVCQDDLLAVTDAGAYGIVLASHYNSHSLPVEVLVDGSRYKVIRRRETYADLLYGEVTDKKEI